MPHSASESSRQKGADAVPLGQGGAEGFTHHGMVWVGRDPRGQLIPAPMGRDSTSSAFVTEVSALT